MIGLDNEFAQYLATALWSSNDESDESGGVPLDREHDADDIAPESREALRAEFAEFVNGCSERALDYWQAELGDGQVGHDFWLTRNGHGAGFWDRFVGGIGGNYGAQLTAAAKAYGTCDLYVGDDGRVHAS